jgi:tRNA-splicing ligase RtcB
VSLHDVKKCSLCWEWGNAVVSRQVGREASRGASDGTAGESRASTQRSPVAEDSPGHVWAVVHSRSRGVGNRLAMQHINGTKDFCFVSDVSLEDPALAHLSVGTTEFDTYVADMLWAQGYAYWQREAMMTRVLAAIEAEAAFSEADRINCHHNYSEEISPGLWLTRKGATAARTGDRGIIPGSMDAATYVVRGLGNTEAYGSSPTRSRSAALRGAAHRGLDLEPF